MVGTLLCWVIYMSTVCLYARVSQHPNPPDGTGAEPLPGSPFNFLSNSHIVGECANEDCLGNAVICRGMYNDGKGVLRIGKVKSGEWGPTRSVLRIFLQNAAVATLSTPRNLAESFRGAAEKDAPIYVWYDLAKGRYLFGSANTYCQK
jgi:hypothetical protein